MTAHTELLISYCFFVLCTSVSPGRRFLTAGCPSSGHPLHHRSVNAKTEHRFKHQQYDAYKKTILINGQLLGRTGEAVEESFAVFHILLSPSTVFLTTEKKTCLSTFWKLRKSEVIITEKPFYTLVFVLNHNLSFFASFKASSVVS